MKIFLLLFLFTSTLVFSEAYFEFSYYPNFAVYDYTSDEVEFMDNLFSTTLYVDKPISIFTIGGEVETMMFKRKNSTTFYPVSVGYGVFIEVNIEDFTVGYEHYCSHPINPYEGWATTNIDNMATDRIFARIEF